MTKRKLKPLIVIRSGLLSNQEKLKNKLIEHSMIKFFKNMGRLSNKICPIMIKNNCKSKVIKLIKTISSMSGNGKTIRLNRYGRVKEFYISLTEVSMKAVGVTICQMVMHV